VTVPLI